MPLDLDSTDPMYLLGRVVGRLEGAFLRRSDRRVSDTGLLDVLLTRPAVGLPLLLKAFPDAKGDGILAILPAGGLPKGPVKIEDQGPYWMGYYHQRGQDQRDLALTTQFTPTVLRQIGETLYGPDHWQAEMARALGLGDTARVRAWMADGSSRRRRVPPGVCRDLLALLRQNAAEAKQIADKLDEAIKKQQDEGEGEQIG
ncbi:hypothetical protein [Methylobacterium sp. Leaf118]|uniref:hypothetical protein n=1 Tax=Methylobacterium sp. Leaf118 TaxID=2876562 RepID=UPI001E35E22C|nr:hypothetical protein [Methylobacterium sp. Leaf118]